MDYKEAGIQHFIAKNDLNSVYFSRNNIDAIQHGIRYSIFNKSSKVIDNQSETELRIIMRSIYLQYSKNLPNNIIEQIKDLNKRVLEFVVPRVLIEMNQYETYLKDASTLPVPLSRGENTSSTGTKFLYRKEF
jgi:hypothetical protein